MAEGRMLKYKNVPDWMKEEVSKRDNFTCQMCGKIGLNDYLSGLAYEMVKTADYDKTWLKPIRFEYDHIIPKSKGGKTIIKNIQLLCRKCNRSKGARMQKCIA